jgi:hypothetical protein
MADAAERVVIRLRKNGEQYNAHATTQIHKHRLAGGYVRGDVVETMTGDEAVVVGPCSNSAVADAAERVLIRLQKNGKQHNVHTTHIQKHRLAGGYVRGDVGESTTSFQTMEVGDEAVVEGPCGNSALGGAAERVTIRLKKDGKQYDMHPTQIRKPEQQAIPPPPPPAGVGEGGVRREAEAEPSIKALPTTRWQDIVPPGSAADALRDSAAVRAACPHINAIVGDCLVKAAELQFEDGLPAQLAPDHALALAAYSHDLGNGTKAGNLYFELNGALRKRGKDDRAAMMEGWGMFMHFLMAAMALLPRFEGVCYRGMSGAPDKAATVAQYKMGRPIQWGAFSSTSTDFNATKGFTDEATGVIFKINVTDGRDINAYSFFPAEDEILLSPSHRFMVCSAPYERDGYTVIDMVQAEGNTFVS